MKIRFFERREVWWPTRWCWLGAFVTALLPLLLWGFCGEGFLSSTHRLDAEVLVVEGWIGAEGLRAAAVEFEQGGYEYVVAAGGLPTTRFGRQVSYAEIAQKELIRFGVPASKALAAPANSSPRQRTFESAAAVWRLFRVKSIQPKALNVFTLGVHARRSRLVFAKVHEPDTKVGAVAWVPSDYKEGHWWNSSERTKDFITETIGELLEVAFSTGRASNRVTLPDSRGAR